MTYDEAKWAVLIVWITGVVALHMLERYLIHRKYPPGQDRTLAFNGCTTAFIGVWPIAAAVAAVLALPVGLIWLAGRLGERRRQW